MESGQAQCGALTAIKETTAKGSRDRHTDRRQASDRGGRQDASLPGRTKNSHPDSVPRSEAISEHTGDKTAMTRADRTVL